MIYTVIILFIIFIDQLSKILITKTLNYLESIAIIENIFHITLVKNYGAAFGILKGQRILFLVISLVVITIFIFYLVYSDESKKLLKFSLSMQIAGAAGNMIDRIRLGYVIDFFDFRIWPVFNIADISIVLGVFILIVLIIKDPEII